MPKYVRVRDEATGHHYSIPERLVCDGVTVLDQSAYTRSRELRKPTYNVPLGGKPAPSAKNSSRPRNPVPAADSEPENNTDGPSADTDKE